MIGSDGYGQDIYCIEAGQAGAGAHAGGATGGAGGGVPAQRPERDEVHGTCGSALQHVLVLAARRGQRGEAREARFVEVVVRRQTKDKGLPSEALQIALPVGATVSLVHREQVYQSHAGRSDGRITLACCWAHARRKFDEAKESRPQSAGTILKLISHGARQDAHL